jgi:hypothetical protein
MRDVVISEGGDVVAAGPLQVRVTPSAELRIGWGDEADWLGPGHLLGFGAGPVAAERGTDGGVVIDAGGLAAAVRAVDAAPVVVLRLETLVPQAVEDPGGFAKPTVAWSFEPSARWPGGAPEGLRAFAYQYTEFALPVFSDATLARWQLLPWRPPVVCPLGLVAPDGRTLLLAPLNAFHDQIIAVPTGSADEVTPLLRAGWHGDLGDIPAGFATELAVIAGRGARETLAVWSRLLREASGVPAPRRDADRLGTHVSYWTDNGSAYWYRTAPGLDMASSVVAAVGDLADLGIRVGAVQLDSWWYPHDVSRALNEDDQIVPPTGMRAWEPRADVLPGGIAELGARLGGRPLVAHCRHLSALSEYANEFPMWVDGERAHPVGPELYERFLDQAVAWGVEVFEHDWLIECFLGVRGLRGAGRAATWQEGIDRALRARNLHAQWCMASPADFAQASRLHAITSIRTSSDHGYLVGPELLWAWFLHTNVLARALGLWPYKDVFRSALHAKDREIEALLAALSAGPVGIGDGVGEADPALIRRVCRADGLLVRPDVPIAAIDRAAYDAPVWSGKPLVASTHTDHAAGRWGYVVACNASSGEGRARTRVDLRDLGEDTPAADELVSYDWRSGHMEVVGQNDGYDVNLERKDWDYRVLAPVLLDNIAIIGDAALYATAGDTRIGDVTIDAPGDGVTAVVLGAGETVTLTGWARGPLRATAWSPATGAAELPLAHNLADGRWTVTLDVGAGGWTNVHLR